MNKQKGNMYPWVNYTINFIKGRCPHGCEYCYMQDNPSWKNPAHLDEKEFETDLGSCNTIFVGSSCDHFAEEIPKEWINQFLTHLEQFSDNTYLFQSKNPKRFYDLIHREFVESKWSKQVILGTTIETNRELLDEVKGMDSRVPSPMNRQFWLRKTPAYHKMISVEPIMDFDLVKLIGWIRNIEPDFVSIGADSKRHNLPEPSSDKIKDLILELSKFTKVKVKSNLKRLTNRK